MPVSLFVYACLNQAHVHVGDFKYETDLTGTNVISSCFS